MTHMDPIFQQPITLLRCDAPLLNDIPKGAPVTLYRYPDGRTQLAIAQRRGFTPLLNLPPEHVRSFTVTDSTTIERRTPGWAVVLGVLGLFVFLIGIVFFFVRTDVHVPSVTIEIVTGSGAVIVAVARDANAAQLQALGRASSIWQPPSPPAALTP